MKLKVEKKTIAKYNVHAFFLQLIASEILAFEWMDNNRKIVCVRNKETDGKYMFRNVKHWSGFEFCNARHGGWWGCCYIQQSITKINYNYV